MTEAKEDRGVQVGDVFMSDISRVGFTVRHERNYASLPFWDVRQFESLRQYTDLKPDVLFLMWTFVHRVALNMQNLQLGKICVDDLADVFRQRFIVEIEDKHSEKLTTMRAGDVVSIETGIHEDSGLWMADVSRGARAIGKFLEFAPRDFSESHVYELYCLAMMVLNQHLNPRGLCVCVWDVALNPQGRGDGNGADVRRVMNRNSMQHGLVGIDLLTVADITGIDFMVLSLKTKITF